MNELSKSQRKVARQIIEKGLQKEYEIAIQTQKEIIAQWSMEHIDSREAYMRLYQTIISKDKHISRRYDRMSGSNYLLIIAAQYVDGLIQEGDLMDLNPENRMIIEQMKSFE